jgi:hypothetical protein
MFRPRRYPQFELSGGYGHREARAGLMPQAWRFEPKGESARRELDESAGRRGLR